MSVVAGIGQGWVVRNRAHAQCGLGCLSGSLDGAHIRSAGQRPEQAGTHNLDLPTASRLASHRQNRNLVISMAANQPTSRPRATQAVRRVARRGALAVAVALAPVVGPIVGEFSGPAEAATRTYTYKVCYKGTIVVSKPYFRKFGSATYPDSRGWRRAGIRFVRKDYTCTRLGNTDFTVYLAVPSYIDNFAGCSATYSCRYGRHVMINQARWRHAVSFWPS